MGGPITASFTAQLPERVRRLVLVDPSGARPIALSPILKAALVPGIGELALGLFGGESLVKGMASDFFDPEHVARFQDKYRVQMMYRGFKRAILSSMRNGMLGSFQEAYQRVGGQGMPVLIFWGRNDATVPFDHSRQILEAIPRAELHVVENCGHIPHYERPDLVNSILIEFLKR
jgi:pimeloyl-ACP methyl ester carboxylesterase